MTSLRKLGFALSVGMLVIAGTGSAYAQAGVSVGQEVSPGELADKLLLPVDSQDPALADELAKNGVDTTDPALGQKIDWPGTIFNAEGGALKIFNCSGQTIKVKTYNSNDSATLVAFQEKSIGNGSAAGLKCATKSCKVRIGSGNVYSPLVGPQVLLSGAKLQTTNSAAIGGGCAVYAKPKAAGRQIEGEPVQ